MSSVDYDEMYHTTPQQVRRMVEAAVEYSVRRGVTPPDAEELQRAGEAIYCSRDGRPSQFAELMREVATYDNPRASPPPSPPTASSSPEPAPPSLEELVQTQAAALEAKLTDKVEVIVQTELEFGKEDLTIASGTVVNEEFDKMAEALCARLKTTINAEVATMKATLLDGIQSDALFGLMAQQLGDMTRTLHEVMLELEDERALTAVLSHPPTHPPTFGPAAEQLQRGPRLPRGVASPSLPRASQEPNYQSSPRGDSSTSSRFTPSSFLDSRYDHLMPESSFYRSSARDRDRYMLPSLRYPGYVGYGPSGSRYINTDRSAPGSSSLYPNSSAHYSPGYGPPPPGWRGSGPAYGDHHIEGTSQGLNAERSRRRQETSGGYDAYEGGLVWGELGSRAGIRRSFSRMARGD